MSSDDEYGIPLRDQKYFGAGLRRKRIRFVPSTSTSGNAVGTPTASSTSAADKYLAITLRKSDEPCENDDASSRAESALSTPSDVDHCLTGSDQKHVVNPVELSRCDICDKLIPRSEIEAGSHESSVTHQIKLCHSHPPSNVDRKRLGLSVLSNYGWDPDSRSGLGAEGDGILHPIKPRSNPERAGIGVNAKGLQAIKPAVPAKLDASKVRQLEKTKKQRASELRDLFYRNDDIAKYLGDVDGGNGG